MTFLKQWATRDLGATLGVHRATARMIPNTEPTAGADTTPTAQDAYAAWKSKNYTASLRTYKSTETGYKQRYGFHQMWRFHKILKRGSQVKAHATNGGLTNATRMAA